MPISRNFERHAPTARSEHRVESGPSGVARPVVGAPRRRNQRYSGPAPLRSPGPSRVTPMGQHQECGVADRSRRPAIRDDLFWATYPLEHQTEKLRARFASMLDRTPPEYLREVNLMSASAEERSKQ